MEIHRGPKGSIQTARHFIPIPELGEYADLAKKLRIDITPVAGEGKRYIIRDKTNRDDVKKVLHQGEVPPGKVWVEFSGKDESVRLSELWDARAATAIEDKANKQRPRSLRTTFRTVYRTIYNSLMPSDKRKLKT